MNAAHTELMQIAAKNSKRRAGPYYSSSPREEAASTLRHFKGDVRKALDSASREVCAPTLQGPAHTEGFEFWILVCRELIRAL